MRLLDNVFSVWTDEFDHPQNFEKQNWDFDSAIELFYILYSTFKFISVNYKENVLIYIKKPNVFQVWYKKCYVYTANTFTVNKTKGWALIHEREQFRWGSNSLVQVCESFPSNVQVLPKSSASLIQFWCKFCLLVLSISSILSSC